MATPLRKIAPNARRSAAGAAIALVAASGVQADTPAVAEILDSINAAYAEIADTPRRAQVRSRAVLRTRDAPDVVTESLAVVLQHGKRVRYEISPGDSFVDATGGGDFGGYKGDGGSLVWVLDDQVMSSRYVTPFNGSSVPETREFRVDHARVPASFGQRFTNPMTAPELPDEFMQANWSATDAVLHGRPMIRLRSHEAIPLSPVAAMEVVFWIDPGTYLVHRMESTAHQNDPGNGIHAQVSNVSDISYEFGVRIEPGEFRLDLGANHEDMTDQTVELLRRKLLWRDGVELE